MPSIPGVPRPELLAPAGNVDALRAAVANGADAVYLGLRSLNARRGAPNFSWDELGEATRFAHLRGVLVYLTANIIIRGDEMADALDAVARAWEEGVDAVIIQDLGLALNVSRQMPEVRIHASTQMDCCNSRTLRVLAEAGFSRATLAREVTIGEIAALTDTVADIEIEVFVHGALCVSRSGRCLMSSMVGGRSANRGLCAQPCRLAYSIVGADGLERPTSGRHLLSTRDLAAVDLLPDLVEAGVSALKIEGRSKSPEYVAIVTAVYREALDRAAADPENYRVLPSEREALEEAFSRGSTEGYLAGIRDGRMMSYARPSDRGVPVGRVTEVRGSEVAIELTRALEAEDVIEVWTSSGRFSQTAGQMLMEGSAVPVGTAGSVVTVAAEGRAALGDRVFRVENTRLLQAARRSYAPAQGHAAALDVPVRFEVRASLGEPLEIRVLARGGAGLAVGGPVEAARTKALSVPEVVEHVGRTGGTGFAAESWDISIEHGVGARFSELHALRREALADLERALLKPWSGRALGRVVPLALPSRRRRVSVPELVVAVREWGVAQACLEAGADRVLLEVEPGESDREPARRIAERLPRVVSDLDAEKLASFLKPGREVAVSDIGSLVRAVEAGAAADADWGLNICNGWTASVLADLGASRVWASPELSGLHLAELAGSSAVPVGAVVFGHVELMVTEHCAISAAVDCSTRCSSCTHRRGVYRLRDEKGFEFPVVTDASGRSHVYNPIRLDLSRALDQVLATGVSAIRLELPIEDVSEAREAASWFRGAIDQVVAGGQPPERALVEPSTSGYHFRTLR